MAFDDVLNAVNGLAFKPVRTTEAKLGTDICPIRNGYLYFTIDTQKIYMGTINGKALPMGGNSGIYYGTRKLTEEETNIQITQLNFSIETDIDGDQIPNVDDLILNVPDGGFYRVMSISGDELIGLKIAMSGSGSGGGVGGGEAMNLRPTIILNSATSYFKVADTANMKIKYKCKSGTGLNDGINYISRITYKIGSTNYEESFQKYFDTTTGLTEDIELDISKYLDSITKGAKVGITIVAYDYYGNYSYNATAYVYLYDLVLQSNSSKFNRQDYNEEGSNIFTYNCKALGGGSDKDFTDRFIIWELLNNEGQPIKGGSFPVSTINSNIQIPVDYTDLAHGAYKLVSYYEATIVSTGYKAVSENEIIILGVYRPIAGANIEPIVLTDFLENENISQYESYILQYFIIDGSNNDYQEVGVQIIDDNTKEVLGDEKSKLNSLSSWIYSFINIGTYKLLLIYNNKEYNLGNLNVIKYSGNAPVLNYDDIDYCLSAVGKSNSEQDKDKWFSKGKNKTSARLENFLWSSNSGWIKDSNGESALKISNGAKLIVDGKDFPILKSQMNIANTEKSGTSGLLIEFDVRFENVSNYNESLIKCISYNGENINSGFKLTGQKATLNTTIYQPDEKTDDSENTSEVDAALSALTQYYNEGQRIHLAYQIPAIVPSDAVNKPKFYFITTYLNGVLSGISKLNINTETYINYEKFQDWNLNNPASLICDSTYGDIYLYNFRVTRNQLEPQEIVKRYIADYENMSDRVEKWKDNNLFDDTIANKISLGKIKDIAKELNVPYILMRGGIKMNKKFGDAFNFDNASPNYSLPYTKSDYRLMSIEMYYQDSETPIYKVPMQVVDANDETQVYNDFSKMPKGNYKAKRGVQVYGQGTSSMVYPVKNLRYKFIDEQDYPVVYDGINVGPEIINNKSDRTLPVEIVCLKADYMESSSSHNTQTANLIYDLCNQMNMKTPPQLSSLYTKDLVTAIRGYPIICFYTETNNETDYYYIGRYNFNLDKATPEPFGFEPKDNGKISLGYELDKDNNVIIDGDGKKHDIIQCWEVLNNNNNSPTKFLCDSKYNTFEENMENEWYNYFEDRYPDKFKKAIDDGEQLTAQQNQDLRNGLFRMATWVNSTATTEARNTLLSAPVYLLTRDKNYNSDKSGQYYKKNGTDYIEFIPTIQTRINCEYLRDSVTQDSKILINEDRVKEYFGTNYGLYSYTYVSDNGNYWWDGKEKINLTTLGLELSGDFTPLHNDVISINYSMYYSGWIPAEIYEKYTYDTADYRLAKFYTEFTQYFDKEFSLFYYVLTLVLLMMDSRAKNMMLASWDQKIWYPIFYDMDTMLGLNNTGYNKFSFDIEDKNNTVFNGYDSVLWNNFRDVFQEEIAKKYNDMRKNGLTLNNLMKRYGTNGADSWNEALMTADALFKFKEPFENGYWDGSDGASDENLGEGKDWVDGKAWIEPGTTNYLYAAQGRRTNHRNWWTSNRLNYFDSEYISYSLGNNKPNTSNTFSFRAYSSPEQSDSEKAQNCIDKVPSSHEFTLTALNNSYQAIMVGNIIYRSQDIPGIENNGLIQAGQTVVLGPPDAKHEVESWILNPTLIADLGDLSDKYLGSWKFPNISTKLTELKFGRTPRSHPDTCEVYYNTLLNNLQIGNSCPLLKKINIGKCTKLFSLDLGQCLNLELVDAYGSGLTYLNLPVGSTIKELYLPNTLKEIVIDKQPYLNILSFDNTANGSHLTKLILKSIHNMNSYDIAYNMITNTTRGCEFIFEDIRWEIKNISHTIIGEDGYINGIKILDELIKENPTANPSGILLKNALTGELVISIEEGKIREYDMYLKYHKHFPNLVIKYNMNGVEKAPVITFYKEENSNSIELQLLADGKTNLGTLVYDMEKETGIKLTTSPIKVSDEQYVYSFTGDWIDKDTNASYYYQKDNDKMDLYDLIPIQDKSFYPKFKSDTKHYKVTFYSYENNQIDSVNVPYNGQYSGDINNYYDSPEDNNLGQHERIAFKGWTTIRYPGIYNNADNISFVDVDNLIVKNTYNLYPYYVKENATVTPSNIWYFKIDNNIISIQDQYRKKIKGKITLPNIDHVDTIGDFSDMINLEEVYFLTNNTYKKINEKAFNNMTIGNNSLSDSPINTATKLKAIYFTEGLKSIGDYAFACQNNLEIVSLMSENLLPNSLEEIGQNAFNRDEKLKFNKLPDNLTSLGTRAFNGTNLEITNLPQNLKQLNSQIFRNNGNVQILVFNSVDFFSASCLQSTGNNYNKDTIRLEINNSTINSSTKNIFNSYLNMNKDGVLSSVELVITLDGNLSEEQIEQTSNLWYNQLPQKVMDSLVVRITIRCNGEIHEFIKEPK